MLNQTWLAQPALFVIEYSLARLWMAWGIQPRAMIGHSIGEYVAACLAGVFSLEDALAVVAARGRLMQQMPDGAILAVPLAPQQVQSFLDGKLSLAAVNAPSQCVVSGPIEAVAELEAQLAERGVDCRRLHTSHAFHSAMMEPILAPFASHLKGIALNPPRIAYMSNVTGTWIKPEEATDPGYWARHLRQTVRFAEGVQQLSRDPAWILLEVGPGRTLSGLARQQADRATGQLVLSSLRHPQDRQSDVAFLLNTLGRLWLSGQPVDWPAVYRHERRRRMPLPTYPFERQRYWVEPQQPGDGAAAQLAWTEKKPDLAEWFYAPSWRQAIRLPPADLAGRTSRWLVFSDTAGLGARLVKRLEQAGQDVIGVEAGTRFTRLDGLAYAIDPRQPEDYAALLKELRATDKTPDTIVHAWGVAPDDPAQPGIEAFESSQYLGFYSLLFLTQALADQAISTPLRMAVVSSNIQAVTGEERLSPERATVLGACKVIPQEYPHITCRNIDVAVPASGAWPDQRLIDRLLAEVTAEVADPIVAYRGSHRWVRAFEPVRLGEAAGRAPQLREGGVYLITGGLGGIGLALAEHLARTARANLVLVGRSALPERERWAEWLAAHDADDGVSQRIGQVQAIEQLGGQVLAISADVADLEAMQAVVRQIHERFGVLHGVIHAAGIAGGGVIQLKAVETAASVLAPKVRGALVLDALLKDVQLDFVVLCSSLASILGGFGQVDYCGANAFLDAYAHRAASEDGRLVVSINWDTWQEVGMAVNTPVPRDLEAARQESLKRGITSKEGAEVFDRLLRARLPQVAVSTTELALRLALASARLASTPQEQPAQAGPSQAQHARPALGSSYAAPRNELEQAIVDVWQELLGIQPVGIHDNFFELGGHSLLALQVISRLPDDARAELSVRTLFDAPTVAELAEQIEQARGAAPEDVEEMARMLELVEQLSEEQIKELLGE